MKFLTDENIGFAVINPLRSLGFDIKSILEVGRGADDISVLSLANREGRILITTDKDFGELVYANKLIHKGVILLRLRNDSSEKKFKVLGSLLTASPDTLGETFTVVTDGTVRSRND